jgi:hypothetical protein
MILKRNSVNWIGKDVKVYCKLWKKIIETVFRSQEVNVAYFLTQVVLKPSGSVEAI